MYDNGIMSRMPQVTFSKPGIFQISDKSQTCNRGGTREISAGICL